MRPGLELPDCQRCGACCVNPKSNRETGYADYVTVDDDDAILRQPELVRRYVVRAKDGKPNLRLTPDGRCKALRGGIGARVRCEIYYYRPRPCRMVECGSELCLVYRRDHDLESSD
ncbi:MAG: YkgJ family cysteine cluster protein [Deltaproteobacteria bacterium]|nr:YkgJ family cysteine cluster protein [Deltaproteobacteria bacterium]